MKLVIVALALVAVAVAAPPPAQSHDSHDVHGQAAAEPIKILRSEFDQQPEGPYTYSFETENGISRNENGELKEVTDEDNKPQNVIVVRGSYTYTDPEGKPVTITYYADETGFHAEGDAIPKEPVPARR